MPSVLGAKLNGSDFAAVLSARLDPILAPRGFPYAARENGVSAPGEPAANNPDSVLFHCDGREEVAEVVARYPGWSTRLRESYGPKEILCLDLWVQQKHGVRSWSFEVFEADVGDVAGADAQQRLERLRTGPLNEWVVQLASMLDAYFTDMEAGHPRSEK